MLRRNASGLCNSAKVLCGSGRQTGFAASHFDLISICVLSWERSQGSSEEGLPQCLLSFAKWAWALTSPAEPLEFPVCLESESCTRESVEAAGFWGATLCLWGDITQCVSVCVFAHAPACTHRTGAAEQTRAKDTSACPSVSSSTPVSDRVQMQLSSPSSISSFQGKGVLKMD